MSKKWPGLLGERSTKERTEQKNEPGLQPRSNWARNTVTGDELEAGMSEALASAPIWSSSLKVSVFCSKHPVMDGRMKYDRYRYPNAYSSTRKARPVHFQGLMNRIHDRTWPWHDSLNTIWTVSAVNAVHTFAACVDASPQARWIRVQSMVSPHGICSFLVMPYRNGPI